MNNFFVKHKWFKQFFGIIGGVLHTLKCKLVCFQKSPSKIKVIADAGQPVDKMMVTVTAIRCNQENSNLKRFVATSRGVEISAFVDWNADLDVSKQQIESRINQIRTDLPAGIQITVER
jgi:hypothetical protein